MMRKFLVKRTGMILDVAEGTDVFDRLITHPSDYQVLNEPEPAPLNQPLSEKPKRKKVNK